MDNGIEIKIILNEKYKSLPGVEEWRAEVEKEFNSAESMLPINTALALLTKAGLMELAEED
ncbi:hypothetical protein KAR91_69855 [Candidatus Pacearchaeota archaeon]|nr:hypothetical protein [Candidatus Pacearchaeota archaeon]